MEETIHSGMWVVLLGYEKGLVRLLGQFAGASLLYSTRIKETAARSISSSFFFDLASQHRILTLSMVIFHECPLDRRGVACNADSGD